MAPIDDYLELYTRGRAWWDSGVPSDELIRVLDAGRLTGRSVLELGCGTGANAVELARRGFEVTAVDLAEPAIRTARERARNAGVSVGFRVADVLTDELGGPYDVLFDRGVYHHLRHGDPGVVRDVLARLTHPGSWWLCLASNAREADERHPQPGLHEAEIRAELGGLFEIVELREFRFHFPNYRDSPSPLAWSILMRRKGEGARAGATGSAGSGAAPRREAEPVRRVALLCVNPVEDRRVYGISYAAYKLQAALLASPRLAGVEVRALELPTGDVEEFMARLEAFDPDVVGLSAYVWSFPALAEVARRVRSRWPEKLIVLGGPSARPSMFALPRFAGLRAAIDALVVGEGEEAMVDVVAAGRRRDALAGVAGLLLPAGDGWCPTAPRPRRAELDSLASPYQLGLASPGLTGRLETYRGCPVQCAFCQVPEADAPSRLYSVEYLTRELRALRANDCQGVFFVDSALNLNSRAFDRLCAAEREVGLLADQMVFLEVFPSQLRPEHLDFLHATRGCCVSVGVQSFDPRVLAFQRRPFSEERFDRILRALERVEVSVDLMLGLPFDGPRALLAAVDRLLARGVSVNVNHYLVLPGTLSPGELAEAQVRFDEESLKVVSCAGWTEETVRETCALLDGRAAALGGKVTYYGWEFMSSRGAAPEPRTGAPAAAPGPAAPGPASGGPELAAAAPAPGPAAPLVEETAPAPPAPPPVEAPAQAVEVEPAPASPPAPAPSEVGPEGPRAVGPHLGAALARGVSRASGDAWHLAQAFTERGRLVLKLGTAAGELLVEARRGEAGDACYRLIDGVAWSYRVSAAAPSAADLRRFRRLIAVAQGLVRRLLEALNEAR